MFCQRKYLSVTRKFPVTGQLTKTPVKGINHKISVTGKTYTILSQEIYFCHTKQFPVFGKLFLIQERMTCDHKILVPKNSCHIKYSYLPIFLFFGRLICNLNRRDFLLMQTLSQDLRVLGPQTNVEYFPNLKLSNLESFRALNSPDFQVSKHSKMVRFSFLGKVNIFCE